MMVDEPGVRFGLAHMLLVLVMLVTGAAGLTASLAFLVVVGAAAAGSLGLGSAWAAGIGVSAWALYTGFAEHAAGLLTFSGHDLLRLCVLVGCAVVLSARRGRLVT
jgi:hypothetical protein